LPPYRGDASMLDSVTRYDFTLTMRDGVIIDCLKFVPVTPPPAGGWPTVIMVHGYGDNKETLAGFCKAQAEYGYYTMTFSVRGQGSSGGLSNLISTVEMQDLLEIINFVRSDFAANPNKILIMGGSQGGALPFMAACNGAPVRTIISSVAPPNFASSWIENGSIKMTFLWTIEYTPDTARYTPLVDRMSNWVYANNRNKWDSLAYWLPKDRDFMNLVPNCKVPMLIEGSWQDKFFNADGIMQGLSLLNAPFSSYLGAVQGHGGDHSPSEDIWHMQWFNDWFFYWLFDINNGILDAPKYQYASTVMPYSNNRWTFIHDSSPVPLSSVTSSLKLYFNRNNRLTYAPGANAYTASFNNRVSGGLTMLEAVNEEFTGPVFNSKFKKAQIYFETTPLPSDCKIAGTPKINLHYSSSANTFCQYNFQLYEVTPNGTKYFVSRLNFTDRYYVKGSKRIKNFKGQAHSHIFKAGNKIRVVVTNLDTAPTDSTFLGTNPFVLPVLNNGTHRILVNKNSYIDLPVIAPPSTMPLAVNRENAPYDYRLEQNYPNPFNPATVIEYSIASSGNVKLVVYDLLGREVKTLVNEFKEAGSHSLVFDARDFSSGIYFYRIKSGGFQDVKRMVFVK
jgi:predicted acyl esterase